MHKVFYNSLELILTLKPKSPFLIKSGVISTNPTLPDMQFVRTKINGVEQVYIPGSSLRGVFRSSVEKILRTIKGDSESCCITGDDSCDNRLKNEEKEMKRKLYSYEIYKKSCKSCKIFGNTRLKSRIYFADAFPINSIKTENRFGVGISRLSHAVAQGPFEMEVVVSGDFKTKIYLENFEIWQIGLIALVIELLNKELITVGFGKNKGFGRIEVKVQKVKINFAKSLSSNEIYGIGKISKKEEREKYGLTEYDAITVDVEPIKVSETLFVERIYNDNGWNMISETSIKYLRDKL